MGGREQTTDMVSNLEQQATNGAEGSRGCGDGGDYDCDRVGHHSGGGRSGLENQCWKDGVWGISEFFESLAPTGLNSWLTGYARFDVTFGSGRRPSRPAFVMTRRILQPKLGQPFLFLLSL